MSRPRFQPSWIPEPTDASQDRQVKRLEAKRGQLGSIRLRPPKPLSKSKELRYCQNLATTLQRLLASNGTPIQKASKPIYDAKIQQIRFYPKYRLYLSNLLSSVTFV